MLDIGNSIITLDAMSFQKEIAQQIIKQKTDYILALKDNHSSMQIELEAWWYKKEREGLPEEIFYQHSDVISGHGRIEKKLTDNYSLITHG